MRRPFRRYLFLVAEKLGRTVHEIQHTMSNNEVFEWMAYDLTNTDEFQKQYQSELEQNKQAQMSAEERSKELRKIFGG